MTKFCSALFFGAAAMMAVAQTNAPDAKSGTNAPPQELVITSDSFYYDGITNQAVYTGHVFVTDNAHATLQCGILTVDLPKEGSPTNIVAQSNVVVNVLDTGGQTNRITAAFAVYSYFISAGPLGMITNQWITFTGTNPKPILERSNAWMQADPIIIDVRTRHVSTPNGMTMRFKQPASGGTNSPFNIMP